jgi:hypothetical protein
MSSVTQNSRKTTCESLTTLGIISILDLIVNVRQPTWWRGYLFSNINMNVSWVDEQDLSTSLFGHKIFFMSASE